MPTFETVPTERTHRVIGGCDHGRDVRVLMRSKDRVAFVSRGVNVAVRGSQARADCLARQATRAALSTPEARQAAVRFFGEGADEAMIAALTGATRGTVLVDGGGDPAPLPHGVLNAMSRERYEAVSPTARNLLAVDAACRQCGAPLKPATRHHSLARIPSDGHPRSLEDCQRLTNEPVYGVIGYDRSASESWWPYVAWFETWDGESLIDPLFCGDSCAARYGRRAAEDLPPLEPGGSPRRRDGRPDGVKHYDEPVRIGPGGLRY